MTQDEYYLDIAKTVSKRSSCLKRHYGAVIVNNNEIVSTGYNGPARGEPHCKTCTKKDGHKDMDEYFSCPAIHAEQNCIISAARTEMLGGTLYLAGFEADGTENKNACPCEICLRLIKNSGIKQVVNSTGIIYLRDEFGVLKPYNPEEKPSKWGLFKRKKND